jgi:hypothetical protein
MRSRARSQFLSGRDKTKIRRDLELFAGYENLQLGFLFLYNKNVETTNNIPADEVEPSQT